MPTGKLTSFGLKAVDSDKWDGNIREAIAVAGKDGQKLVQQHNGIGGALFSVSDSGGNAVVFEKGSANGSWVRAADQSVKVDNVTYFTSIPTNAGGLSHWRATRLIIRGGQIHDADS